MKKISIRPDTLEITFLVAYYKVLFFLVAFMSIKLLPPLFSFDGYYKNLRYVTTGPNSIGRFFETWDTQHYLYISASGYSPGKLSAAFFPLWPLCIRVFSYLTGGSLLLSGLILANLLSVAALVLLYRHVSQKEGAPAGEITLLLMLAFPSAFFLFFPYSESLFLLLSVLIFVQLEKNNYLNACMLAFLAVLTRPLGLFWAVPIGLHMLKNRRFASLAYLAIPASGYLCYLAIMYFSTGNPFEGFQTEKVFAAHPTILKMFDLPGFIRGFFSVPNKPHEYLFSIVDRLLFFLFLLSLWPLYRRDKVLFSYAVLMGLVPALANSLMSFSRYALMVVPMFVVAATYLARPQRRKWAVLVSAALFGLQLILLIRHMNFYWAA